MSVMFRLVLLSIRVKRTSCIYAENTPATCLNLHGTGELPIIHVYLFSFEYKFGICSSDIDGNQEYDSLDILGQDAEEKYFDEEEPESVHSGGSSEQDSRHHLEEEVDDYELYDVDAVGHS